MASKLPVIRAHIDEDIKKKMEALAKEHDRSLSKELAQACKYWIAKYEAENAALWGRG